MDIAAVASLQVLVLWVWIFGVLFGGLTLWRLFTKAGHPGWAALIPFYNLYLFTRIAGKPGWWAVLILAPPITLVAVPMVMLGLGRNFGRSPLSGLFPPLLADGDAAYVGTHTGGRAAIATPRRGAFLTAVLVYLFLSLSLSTIGMVVAGQPIAGVLLLALLVLAGAIWRWNRWAVYAFLAMWAVNMAVDYFVLFPGPRGTYVTLFGVIQSLFPVVLLMWALPIGRRLAGAAAVACLLTGAPCLVAAGQDQAPAPAGIVAVKLAQPAFLWRDVSTRVLVDVTKTSRVPLSDFDMAAAVGAACVEEMNKARDRAWRVAEASEMPALEPYFAGKSTTFAPAGPVDRVLALYLVEYGALKVFVAANRKFFLNSTALLFEPRSGKEFWRRGYIERIDVEGRFEDLVANGERGLKDAALSLASRFCGNVRARVESGK